MRILIIGGSKGLGLAIAQAAVNSGHVVSVFSRSAGELQGIKHISGNALDYGAVKRAISGHDIVVCSLGLPTRQAIGPPLAKKSYVLSKGISNIVRAMEEAGIKRLICITAIGTNESVRQTTILCRLVLRGGLRWLFKEKDKQENIIRASRLSYTFIRPTALTNGRISHPVITEGFNSGVLSHISRQDVARKIVDLFDDKQAPKTLSPSYKPRFGDSVRWTLGFFGIR